MMIRYRLVADLREYNGELVESDSYTDLKYLIMNELTDIQKIVEDTTDDWIDYIYSTEENVLPEMIPIFLEKFEYKNNEKQLIERIIKYKYKAVFKYDTDIFYDSDSYDKFVIAGIDKFVWKERLIVVDEEREKETFEKFFTAMCYYKNLLRNKITELEHKYEREENTKHKEKLREKLEEAKENFKDIENVRKVEHLYQVGRFI